MAVNGEMPAAVITTNPQTPVRWKQLLQTRLIEFVCDAGTAAVNVTFNVMWRVQCLHESREEEGARGLRWR